MTLAIGTQQTMISPYKLWIQAKGDSAEYKRLLFKHGCIRIKEKKMHYRNGREAKNGDKVIQLGVGEGKVFAVGILHDSVPGNDYCNGSIAPTLNHVVSACLVDCIHADDLEAILVEKGLHKRPEGK